MQVITEVLQVCGSDIDAAIKHLGELQLSADSASDMNPPPTLRLSSAQIALRKAANGAQAVPIGVVVRAVIHCV